MFRSRENDDIRSQVARILEDGGNSINQAESEYEQYLAANRARQRLRTVTGLNPSPEFLVAHATRNLDHMAFLGDDLNAAANEPDTKTLDRMASNLGDAHMLSRKYLGLRAPAREDAPEAWDTDNTVRVTYGDLSDFINRRSQQEGRDPTVYVAMSGDTGTPNVQGAKSGGNSGTSSTQEEGWHFIPRNKLAETWINNWESVKDPEGMKKAWDARGQLPELMRGE
ncbi:MAG: hypothetical protein HQL63_05920 [Magnetococcales bacterium]|nr:hypothetical protein [Magnetococcales bacterium]